ncbi:hypothetical protein B296_00003212 [Ensete ventricosum]|uniref:Uncharacterized protein n=1 Tax=Ensete ventricosum TaxID=4639 RepID=A0A427AAR5_ENSVE|nr:hypothetical protein B296_00003212 [Ensete ventricosum]
MWRPIRAPPGRTAFERRGLPRPAGTRLYRFDGASNRRLSLDRIRLGSRGPQCGASPNTDAEGRASQLGLKKRLVNVVTRDATLSSHEDESSSD